MTTAVLVHQPVRGDDAGRAVAAVADRLRAADTDGVAALVPEVDVATVSLFVRRPAERPAELVWYLEVAEDAAAAHRPADAVAGSPLLADELGGSVGAPGDWTCLSDRDGSLAVHATLDGRPRWVGTTSGTAPLVVNGDEPARSVDVVILDLRIRPGLPSRLLSAGVRVLRALDRLDWVERRVEAWTQPVLEAERMFTESIFLARTARGPELRWYMEVADFAEAVDAYAETPSRLARLSEVTLSWLFEEPGVLRERNPTTAYELLAHAVSPERP